MLETLKTAHRLYKGHGGKRMFFYALNRAWYAYHRYVLNKQFLEKRIHNYVMQLNLHDEGISRALMFFGTREEDHRYILQTELRPGMTVLDLGANIGYYAIMESKIIGPTGHIYAVEPHPENFKQLQKNIRLNKIENQVEFFLMGGSNRCGVEKLFVSKRSNQHSFCDTRGEKNIANIEGDGALIDVPTTTISEFKKGKRQIDFIRMDIEGYEVEVFEGMLPALDEDPSFRPSILFETHKPKYREPDHSLRKMLQELFKRGYYPKILISDELPRARFKEYGYHPQHVLPSDGIVRGLYYNMPAEDAIKFACDIGSVRGLFLEYRIP